MNRMTEMIQLANAMRMFVIANSKTMNDAEALSVSGLHEKWEAGKIYKAEDVGKVVWWKGKLYRIVSAHTAQAHFPPDGEGLLALYRPIVVGHAGTAADPIPYIYGMDVSAGLYYVDNGTVWIAKKDMMPCVWNPAEGNEWEKFAGN